MIAILTQVTTFTVEVVNCSLVLFHPYLVWVSMIKRLIPLSISVINDIYPNTAQKDTCLCIVLNSSLCWLHTPLFTLYTLNRFSISSTLSGFVHPEKSWNLIMKNLDLKKTFIFLQLALNVLNVSRKYGHFGRVELQVISLEIKVEKVWRIEGNRVGWGSPIILKS